MSHSSSKEKFTTYLPTQIMEDMRKEAKRQDRSINWLITQAWLMSRDSIAAFPTVKGVDVFLPASNGRSKVKG